MVRSIKEKFLTPLVLSIIRNSRFYAPFTSFVAIMFLFVLGFKQMFLSHSQCLKSIAVDVIFVVGIVKLFAISFIVI